MAEDNNTQIMLNIIEASSKETGNYSTALSVAKKNPLYKYLLQEETRRSQPKKRKPLKTKKKSK